MRTGDLSRLRRFDIIQLIDRKFDTTEMDTGRCPAGPATTNKPDVYSTKSSHHYKYVNTIKRSLKASTGRIGRIIK